MATAIGTRAAKHGHTIELMSRNRQGSGTRRPDRQALLRWAIPEQAGALT
jgi:hypothetical protein